MPPADASSGDDARGVPLAVETGMLKISADGSKANPFGVGGEHGGGRAGVDDGADCPAIHVDIGLEMPIMRCSSDGAAVVGDGEGYRG